MAKEEKIKKPEYKLVLDKSTNYKLIVNESLENKIRYLCAKFPDNEYSGALFYRTHGSIEDKDLVIECVDFCLCDVGSSVYTEFETKPEVVSYMCNHDLLDCYIGLMHSHDKMSTFFSGTDTDTLKAEGSSMPHFVSLIVNNKGEYTAAITSKVTRTFQGTVTEDKVTFGNKVISPSSEIKTFSDVCIIYNYLDIEVERDSWYMEIEDKISDIDSAKVKQKSTLTPTLNNNLNYWPSYDNNKPIQLKMFDTDDIEGENIWDEVQDESLCEDVLKKALFLNPSKDVSDNSIIESIQYFISNTKKYSNSQKTSKVRSALKRAIENACNAKINSIAAMNLCNDLAVFIDSFNYNTNSTKVSQSIDDTMNLVFDVLMELTEN